MSAPEGQNGRPKNVSEATMDELEEIREGSQELRKELAEVGMGPKETARALAKLCHAERFAGFTGEGEHRRPIMVPDNAIRMAAVKAVIEVCGWKAPRRIDIANIDKMPREGSMADLIARIGQEKKAPMQVVGEQIVTALGLPAKGPAPEELLKQMRAEGRLKSVTVIDDDKDDEEK